MGGWEAGWRSIGSAGSLSSSKVTPLAALTGFPPGLGAGMASSSSRAGPCVSSFSAVQLKVDLFQYRLDLHLNSPASEAVQSRKDPSQQEAPVVPGLSPQPTWMLVSPCSPRLSTSARRHARWDGMRVSGQQLIGAGGFEANQKHYANLQQQWSWQKLPFAV